ncbi:uncharacterized protein K489DRAFT_380316 [Dissoconium aciculare CBS 342.82]|uniref:Uncharacterized protein n=1 Tax=Dissoconium aciculare CBS 342.82 TaxID=1314786 RepID=A0A6J3M5W7_9PEZI|nr:uncharacterized protein K489DRAFT_380316 [Dissoconium aciculare CBS 342.82]KAF1822924.1 hypothetical protein K489DRAFT_380316 [Dissoconium aciculare CBS 342.82]
MNTGRVRVLLCMAVQASFGGSYSGGCAFTSSEKGIGVMELTIVPISPRCSHCENTKCRTR